jgi:hypothetical protein
VSNRVTHCYPRGDGEFFQIEIDHEALYQRMLRRAAKAKSGKASALYGAIKAKIILPKLGSK